MAAGYLDLLQRELRNTVIHLFATAGDLSATVGIEGQIASTEGSFYIFTGGAWRRILDEADLALIQSEMDRSAAVYAITIDPSAAATGSYPVWHGFVERPLVEVTGPDGAVIGVDIVHFEAESRCQVIWDGILPTPARVTVVGLPATRYIDPGLPLSARTGR